MDDLTLPRSRPRCQTDFFSRTASSIYSAAGPPATGDEEPLVAQLAGRARALDPSFQSRVIEVSMRSLLGRTHGRRPHVWLGTWR